MKVEIIAHIKEIKDGAANVHCKIVQEFAIPAFMSIAFETILKAMKDTDKRAFYEAMSKFANEDFDDAMEFLTGEMTMIKIQYCNCCGGWFQPRENDGHIVVKRTGYAPRYYCGACMIQNQISRKGELQNEHK